MFVDFGYKITEKVYEGIRYVIYRAIRRKDGLPVIIKMPNTDHPDSYTIVLLKHEYEIAQKINNDSIAKIYEFTQVQNIPALIEEDFNGISLETIMKNHRLDIKEFLQIAVNIAKALYEIHKHNIIHNDITPNNILINMMTKEVKIIDFGYAAMLSKENRSMESFNSLNKNLYYISPEQTGRMNCLIDYRTDFYSLGITFYQMLTGILPFQSKDELTLIHSHLAVKPLPPDEYDCSIPSVVSDIVMKLTEKMVENRYQSAWGLKNDLEICHERLQANGDIKYFKIGQKDISDRFQVPQRLYGREEETTLLLKAFDRVCSGNKELMMITGYSGIGKSSLINGIYLPITRRHGYFISGKFEQFHHDIPYSAMVQVFRSLVNLILAENQEQITLWKDKLTDALGCNGKIIIDIIPEVERIIGKQPDIIELPAEETRNRFNLVFQNFIGAFCNQEHPLVIFLDDLQWSDMSTLKLIQTFMSREDAKYLLIIMAYRDNEVYGAHPLKITMEEIRNSGISVNTLSLKPLNINHISELLADTLHWDRDSCKKNDIIHSFAKLCLSKTEGNPFFLNQFLHTLYQENLISFKPEDMKWEWNMELIINSGITDNVIELMIRKIKKLPMEVQKTLMMGACIGNGFELKILSLISKKPEEEVFGLLEQALIEGLIVVEKNSMDFNHEEFRHNDLRFHFLHDRIQQAAYEIFEDSNINEIHLELGRILFMKTNKEEYEEKVFEILNHYNLGIELISDSDEIERLIELELIAARKAKKSMAYEIAYRCITLGLDLLSDNCWKLMYRQSLEIYTEAAEISYLNGNFDEMLQLTEMINNNVVHVLDFVNSYKIRIQACVSAGRISEAVNYALEIIKALGKNIPKSPSKLRVLFKLLRVRALLKNKDIKELADLPSMTNDNYKSIISVLSLIGPVSYRMDQIFMSMVLVEAIESMMKYGNADESPFFYAGYGLVACSLGDIEAGYRFGRLALQIISNKNITDQKARVIFMNNAFISHWKEHLRNLLPAFKEGYESGLIVGDYEFAAYNGFYYCNKSFYAGVNLEVLDQEMAGFLESLKNMRQEPQLHLLQIMAQLVRNLSGKSKDPVNLSGELYNEDIMMPLHLASKDYTAVSSVFIIKLILSYTFEYYDAAEKNAELTGANIENLQSTVAVPTFHFYDSLTKLAAFDGAIRFKQKKILKSVASNQKKMKKWADFCPENYMHKYYIVEAEFARVLEKNAKAMDLYSKAISLANKNGFIQDEALANELAAKFYILKNEKKLGRFFMKESLYCYSIWGASAKVKQLKEKYPSLVSKIEERNYQFGPSLAEAVINKASRILDAGAIIKATQAISGEIRLDELNKKLVHILLENAGAQRAAFLIKRDDKFIVEVEGIMEGDYIKIVTEEYKDEYINLPKKVLQYALNSKTSVIIDNTRKAVNFMNDPYLADNQPKSIMCMPVISKGEITGLLYLENNLIEGAFNSERIEILGVISSQLAISLENANVYNRLEELVEERTQELKKEIFRRQEAQKLLEEMATHDYLTGLANRKLFQETLSRNIGVAKMRGTILAVIFIDLDDFKPINDNHGHESGDAVIKVVSSRLQSLARAEDLVSRLGGDEFTIILENIDDILGINAVCERIINEIKKSIIIGGHKRHITASIGVSLYPFDGENVKDLINKADEAMYTAKKMGKNRYVIHS